MNALVVRILRRQLLADRWVALALVLLVAVTTALGLGALGAVDDAARRDRAEVVGRLPVGKLDVVGSTMLPLLTGTASDPAAGYEQAARTLPAGSAAPVRDILRESRWSVHTDVMTVGAFDAPVRRLGLQISTAWTSRTVVAAGRMPATASGRFLGSSADVSTPERPTRVEVAVSSATATAMRLTLGEELPIAKGPGDRPLTLVVTGFLTVTDPADAFWSGQPSAVRADVVTPPSGPLEATGVAFAGPGALPQLESDFRDVPFRLELRHPVDPARAAARDPFVLVRQLRAMEADATPLPFRGAVAMRSTTALDDELVGHLGKRRPVLLLAGFLLVAMIAASAAVLLLAAQLLLERRRAALALASARGASTRQTLTLLAVEALLLGLLGSALGAVVGGLAPGDAGTWTVVFPLVVALLPVITVTAAAIPLLGVLGGGGRRVEPLVGAAQGAAGAGGLAGVRRANLRRHGGLAAGVLLSALAVLAVTALRQRGLDAAPPPGAPGGDRSREVPVESGVDGLVAAVPTLVAVTVALVAGRAVGPPMRALTAVSARRRGAVWFLGLARAARAPGGGGWGLVAVGLAVAVATLGAVVAATTEQGARVAADQAVGADVRLTAADAGPEDAAVLAGRGATAVAVLSRPTAGRLAPADRPGDVRSVDVVLTEVDALARVHGALADRVLSDATVAAFRAGAPGGDRLPVAVSAGWGPVGGDAVLTIGARPLPARIVAVLPRLPGAIPAGGSFVLADVRAVRGLTGLTLSGDVVLARFDGVPSAEAIRGWVPSVTSVQTREQFRRESDRSPLASVLRTGLPAVLVTGLAYASGAAVLVLLLGARARGRFLAHLRALGMSGRQSAALVAFEALPAAVTGLGAGLAAGLGLAWLVLPVTDLRPLTGSATAPAIVLGWETVAAVAGCFVLVVAVAVVAAAFAGRAVSLTEVARTVEGS